MASAVDSRLAYARLSAVATASRLPTATRGSNNSYTTSWDTTETVPMLLWALLASGQIQMRKVDGWETLDQLIADETLDRAA